MCFHNVVCASIHFMHVFLALKNEFFNKSSLDLTYELRHEKTNNLGSDQVQHKSVTGAG